MCPVLKEDSQVIQPIKQAIFASAISLNEEKYLHCANDFEMSEEQKQEFLRVLWNIMAEFVNLGFGVDSVLTILAQRSLEERARTFQSYSHVAINEDSSKKNGARYE